MSCWNIWSDGFQRNSLTQTTHVTNGILYIWYIYLHESHDRLILFGKFVGKFTDFRPMDPSSAPRISLTFASWHQKQSDVKKAPLKMSEWWSDLISVVWYNYSFSNTHGSVKGGCISNSTYLSNTTIFHRTMIIWRILISLCLRVSAGVWFSRVRNSNLMKQPC